MSSSLWQWRSIYIPHVWSILYRSSEGYFFKAKSILVSVHPVSALLKAIHSSIGQCKVIVFHLAVKHIYKQCKFTLHNYVLDHVDHTTSDSVIFSLQVKFTIHQETEDQNIIECDGIGLENQHIWNPRTVYQCGLQELLHLSKEQQTCCFQ